MKRKEDMDNLKQIMHNSAYGVEPFLEVGYALNEDGTFDELKLNLIIESFLSTTFRIYKKINDPVLFFLVYYDPMDSAYMMNLTDGQLIIVEESDMEKYLCIRSEGNDIRTKAITRIADNFDSAQLGLVKRITYKEIEGIKPFSTEHIGVLKYVKQYDIGGGKMIDFPIYNLLLVDRIPSTGSIIGTEKATPLTIMFPTIFFDFEDIDELTTNDFGSVLGMDFLVTIKKRKITYKVGNKVGTDLIIEDPLKKTWAGDGYQSFLDAVPYTLSGIEDSPLLALKLRSDMIYYRIKAVKTLATRYAKIDIIGRIIKAANNSEMLKKILVELNARYEAYIARTGGQGEGSDKDQDQGGENDNNDKKNNSDDTDNDNNGNADNGNDENGKNGNDDNIIVLDNDYDEVSLLKKDKLSDDGVGTKTLRDFLLKLYKDRISIDNSLTDDSVKFILRQFASKLGDGVDKFVELEIELSKHEEDYNKKMQLKYGLLPDDLIAAQRLVKSLDNYKEHQTYAEKIAGDLYYAETEARQFQIEMRREKYSANYYKFLFESLTDYITDIHNYMLTIITSDREEPIEQMEFKGFPIIGNISTYLDNRKSHFQDEAKNLVPISTIPLGGESAPLTPSKPGSTTVVTKTSPSSSTSTHTPHVHLDPSKDHSVSEILSMMGYTTGNLSSAKVVSQAIRELLKLSELSDEEKERVRNYLNSILVKLLVPSSVSSGTDIVKPGTYIILINKTAYNSASTKTSAILSEAEMIVKSGRNTHITVDLYELVKDSLYYSRSTDTSMKTIKNYPYDTIRISDFHFQHGGTLPGGYDPQINNVDLSLVDNSGSNDFCAFSFYMWKNSGIYMVTGLLFETTGDSRTIKAFFYQRFDNTETAKLSAYAKAIKKFHAGSPTDELPF